LAEYQHDQERRDDPHRRRGLDPRRVEAALAVGRMLGDVGGGTTVLAAERQALERAHQQQQDWGGDADASVVRQHADQEGRQTHQAERQHEGEFASDEIAEMTEEDGAERPRDKPEPKDGEASQERQLVIARREEMLGKNGGEHAVDVEVVPLDERADRGRADDEAETLFAGRAATRRCCRYRHRLSPVSCETGLAVPRRPRFRFRIAPARRSFA